MLEPTISFLFTTMEFIMTQQTKKQAEHRGDALNQNKGTSGTNKTNAKVHGNRGKQLNPNQKAR